ncbi:DNA-binding domain-containing protein [Artemisia annua]|uniref:DNA-binding domain-containing protein n=1 Tax=Artemisia annua TaxID=35608 RepID=A0A2U1N8Q2_ARTAN|nr:DNA-binding domain-containing protein [Artemisia annua]
MYNSSLIQQNAHEEYIIVAALSNVIGGGGHDVGPSDRALVIEQPQTYNETMFQEQETCRLCGTQSPGCLGCQYFEEGGEEEMRLSRKKNKYKGVSLKPSGKWAAEIMVQKKRKWLGTYGTEEEAARAYDMASIRYRGKNAKTNFPVREYPEIQQEESGQENPSSEVGFDGDFGAKTTKN